MLAAQHSDQLLECACCLGRISEGPDSPKCSDDLEQVLNDLVQHATWFEGIRSPCGTEEYECADLAEEELLGGVVHSE